MSVGNPDQKVYVYAAFSSLNKGPHTDMGHQESNSQTMMPKSSEIVFQLQPTPCDSSPTTTDPPPKESISSRFPVVFESISSHFRVVFEPRLKIDSKTTEKRLEIDSLGGGSVVVGDESRGRGAVAEKQFHYPNLKTMHCEMPGLDPHLCCCKARVAIRQFWERARKW